MGRPEAGERATETRFCSVFETRRGVRGTMIFQIDEYSADARIERRPGARSADSSRAASILREAGPAGCRALFAQNGRRRIDLRLCRLARPLSGLSWKSNRGTTARFILFPASERGGGPFNELSFQLEAERFFQVAAALVAWLPDINARAGDPSVRTCTNVGVAAAFSGKAKRRRIDVDVLRNRGSSELC